MELLKDVKTTVKTAYPREKAVFPLTLPRETFITIQYDNLDISVSDYHGTALSVTVHPTREYSGHRFPFPIIERSDFLFHYLMILYISSQHT